MSNYQPGDKISRAEARRDLKEDFEVRRPFHTIKDIFVNLARLAGISDRDKSQLAGTVLMVVTAVLICSLIAAVW